MDEGEAPVAIGRRWDGGGGPRAQAQGVGNNRYPGRADRPISMGNFLLIKRQG